MKKARKLRRTWGNSDELRRRGESWESHEMGKRLRELFEMKDIEKGLVIDYEGSA